MRPIVESTIGRKAAPELRAKLEPIEVPQHGFARCQNFAGWVAVGRPLARSEKCVSMHESHTLYCERFGALLSPTSG
jgi:hypothetical protein